MTEQRETDVPPSRALVRGSVHGSAGVDLAGLPSPSALFRLEASALGPHWRVALGAAHRLRVRIGDVGILGASGELSLWAGSARGCGVPTWRRLEFPICALVEAGAVRGRGRGFPGADRDTAPWIALLAAPGALWRFHRHVGLWLEAEIGTALIRSRWSVEGVPGALSTGLVVGRVGLGIDVRFPR
jgi:hypothetical protein